MHRNFFALQKVGLQTLLKPWETEITLIYCNTSAIASCLINALLHTCEWIFKFILCNKRDHFAKPDFHIMAMIPPSLNSKTFHDIQK